MRAYYSVWNDTKHMFGEPHVVRKGKRKKDEIRFPDIKFALSEVQTIQKAQLLINIINSYIKGIPREDFKRREIFSQAHNRLKEIINEQQDS